MSYSRNLFKTPNYLLWWAGWTANIHSLTRQGWEFASHEDPFGDMLSIALRHPRLRVYGKTRPEPWRQMYDEMIHTRLMEDTNRGKRPLDVMLAMDYRIDERAYNFQPFIYDPSELRDSSIEMREGKSMADLRIFKPANVDAKKILLDEVSVSEILDIALSKQKPMQDKIRQKMLRDKRWEEYRMGGKTVAEIQQAA